MYSPDAFSSEDCTHWKCVNLGHLVGPRRRVFLGLSVLKLGKSWANQGLGKMKQMYQIAQNST